MSTIYFQGPNTINIIYSICSDNVTGYNFVSIFCGASEGANNKQFQKCLIKITIILFFLTHINQYYTYYNTNI